MRSIRCRGVSGQVERPVITGFTQRHHRIVEIVDITGFIGIAYIKQGKPPSLRAVCHSWKLVALFMRYNCWKMSTRP